LVVDVAGVQPVIPMATPIPNVPKDNVPMGVALAPAKRFAECPISFEPLHMGPVGVFMHGTARVSSHYFNLEAARHWLSSGNGMCPLTRNAITGVMAIPDVRIDPDGWFSAVDLDHNNKLTRFEAVEALKAQFPVDVAAIDAALADPAHTLWQQWDIDGSGTLERNELLAKPGGLVASIASGQLFSPQALSTGQSPPLDLSNKMAWFDYWDSPLAGGDNSGTLDKEEVIRGLLKTLRITSDAAHVTQMRSTLDAVWCIFDTDGSGTIERGEFLQADGLADTVVATLSQAS